jgi:cysteine-rich repeat protein
MSLNLRAAIVILLTGTVTACGGGEGGDDDDDDDDDDVVSETCGDGVADENEACDDGNLDPGDGCDETCSLEPTAYRIDFLEIRDPHLFALDGAFDATETVNGSIAEGVGADGDDPPDGTLDLSILMVFRPEDAAAATTSLDAVIAPACAPPAATTTCAPDEGTTVIDSTATNGDATCLAPAADSTGGYEPAITTPGGRCFSSDPETVSILAAGVQLSLTDAQLAATYGADGTLESGLLSGFMTEAAAMETILPEDTLLVGGMPLSNLLLEEDQDIGPGGETGWWFYFNFTAVVVPYTD